MLKEAFDLISHTNFRELYNLVELTNAMIAVINGQHIILSLFYCAREIIFQSGGSLSENVLTISTSKKYISQYNNFINAITQYLHKQSGLEFKKAEECVLKSMDTYLNFVREKHQNKSFLISLKKRLEKKLPEPFKQYLKPLINFVRSPIYLKKQRINFNKYFNQFDSESQKELDTIVNFIKQHDIR